MKGRFHIVEERIGTHLLKSRATGWYHPSLLALTHILTPRAFCAALSPCMLCERHEPVAKVRADPSRHYTAVTKGERMIPHHGKANTHTLCTPCNEPAITTLPNVHPHCTTTALSALHPCYVTASTPALCEQHRNACPLHARRPAYPGGTSQHSPTATYSSCSGPPPPCPWTHVPSPQAAQTGI